MPFFTFLFFPIYQTPMSHAGEEVWELKGSVTKKRNERERLKKKKKKKKKKEKKKKKKKSRKKR